MNITLEQLLKEEKYKLMSKDELKNVIDINLLFDEYKVIRGESISEKITTIWDELHPVNKYNLQVGDKIKILSIWEIKEINNVGIILVDWAITHKWENVNKSIDSGDWSIVEKATPSKKMYTIEELKGKEIAIHAPTKELAVEIDKFIVQQLDGRSLVDNWGIYKENTAYYCDVPINSYSNLSYAEKNYKVITFDQIKQPEIQTNMKETKPPYDKGSTYSAELINTHPYFRTLSIDQLSDIISARMSSTEWGKLEGGWSNDKAQKLFNKWKQEVPKEEVLHYVAKKELAYINLSNNSATLSVGTKLVPQHVAAFYFSSLGILDNPEFFEAVKKPQYKVGEFIFVTRAGMSYTSEKNVGKVLKIVKINSSNYVKSNYKAPDGSDCEGIYLDEFRLATEDEIKASQIVKITVGIPTVELAIKNNGLINGELNGNKIETTVDRLKEIVDSFNKLSTISGYKVKAKDVSLQIGCDTVGFTVTLDEIKEIIKKSK